MRKYYAYLGGKEALKAVTVTAFGILSGFATGLLGAGGGIITVYLLRYMLSRPSVNGHNIGDISEKDILANSLAITLPSAAVSALIYGIKGNLSDVSLTPYVVPAIIGGIIGAFLLNKLDRRVISTIFAALVIYSGASMLFG